MNYICNNASKKYSFVFFSLGEFEARRRVDFGALRQMSRWPLASSKMH
jgi:hypothetical protein